MQLKKSRRNAEKMNSLRTSASLRLFLFARPLMTRRYGLDWSFWRAS